MDSLGRILAVSFLSSLLVFRCRAENTHTFNWGFDVNFVQTTFQECQTFPIRLISLNGSTGTPPYYMMAYGVEGTTIVSPIGDDPDSLQWQVRHPQGSQLLLTLVDGDGNTGGFSSNFFDVVAGNTTCQPPAPKNPPPVVSPNVTTTLTTCDPWGLTITGGVKPYTISLAALKAPVITNVTMGPEDDVFTFVDRADPGSQLVAAVVDATGQWGISSVAVNTAGPPVTNDSCPGQISTSMTKAEVQSEAAVAEAAAAKAVKAKNTAIALGVVFGLVLPLILAGTAFWYWRRRRRLLARGVVDGQDARPRPFEPGMQERAIERPSLNLDTSMVQVNSQLRRTPSWVVDANRAPGRQTDSPTSMDMASTEIGGSAMPTPFLTSPQVQSSVVVSMIRSPQSHLPTSAVSRTVSMARTPISPPELGAMTPNSTSPAATLSPAQRYRKVLEAHAEAQAARARLASGSGLGLGSGSPSSVGSSRSLAIPGPSSRPIIQRSQSATVLRQFPPQPVPRRAGSSLRLPPVAAIPEAGPDIIIQHRDGGIVEELPPPYPATPGPSTPSPTQRSSLRQGSARPPPSA